MANSGSNKRSKTSKEVVFPIAALPQSLLGDVAAYLAEPSRALFAVAVTAPSSSWSRFKRPSAASKVILSSSSSSGKWAVLDFTDIDKNLASSLSDDDIGAILTCIDAANNLKTLKLAGCVNISGRGLDHLRDSVVLEHIDLSLVGQHENPVLETEPLISEAAVLPILTSIVRAHEGSLKHLQLPKKFSRQPSPILDSFLEEYEQLLVNREHCCSKCNRVCEGNERYESWIDRDQGDDCYRTYSYGLQNYTCSGCSLHFCQNWDNGGCNALRFCEHCEKSYCEGCVDSKHCAECWRFYCKACATLKQCEVCDMYFDNHRSCEPQVMGRLCCGRRAVCTYCDEYYICANEECNKQNCCECEDDENHDVVKCVLGCRTTFCFNCRYVECLKDWESCCSHCIQIMLPRIIKGYREHEKRQTNEGATETSNVLCKWGQRREGCRKSHCRNPSRCGACLDDSESNCALCGRCHKEGCEKQHCLRCHSCGNDVSHCADCDEAVCFKCRANTLDETCYDSCLRCIEILAPTFVKGYEENKERERES